MCGRFAQRTDPRTLAKVFKVSEVPPVEPRYNIAPTQEDILGVRDVGDGREMEFFKWGLIPSWAKDSSIGARLINARSETVTEKPSFREAFKRKALAHPGRRLLRVAAGGPPEAAIFLSDARWWSFRVRRIMGAVGRPGRGSDHLLHHPDDRSQRGAAARSRPYIH